MASDYSVALVSVLPSNKTWNSSHTNFTNLPTPSDYKMTSTTLVSNARNSAGFLITTIVREGIRKIEMTWKYLSQTQFSLVAKLFEGTGTGGVGAFTCYLNYYDTIRGAYIDSYTEYNTSNERRSFYVGDRVCDSAKVKLDNNGKVVGYENVRLSLIEC